MRDTFLRLITDDEKDILYDMMQEEDDNESSYRAKIILFKDDIVFIFFEIKILLIFYPIK